MSNTLFKLPNNRRPFLKTLALMAGGMIVSPIVSALEFANTVELNLAGKHYRSTAAGLILLSTDQGFTWHEIANFGTDVSIDAIKASEQGGVRVHLSNQFHTFWVQSNNDQVWYTADYVAPVSAGKLV